VEFLKIRNPKETRREFHELARSRSRARQSASRKIARAVLKAFIGSHDLLFPAAMRISIAAAQPADRQHWLVRYWPWLVVAAILAGVGFIRLRLLDIPLERDEGEYAYVGQLILQGIPPYELAYSMKLPGTDFAYAAGMAVFGQTPAGVHTTLLTVNSLTIIFMFLLGRRLFGVAAGLSASAVYALTSVSVPVLGLAAHATQFVVLFAVPGALLLWHANALASGEKRSPWFFASGLLFGLAFMMKQPGLVFAGFGLAMLVWDAAQKRTLRSRECLQTLAAYCAGVLLPFLLFVLATWTAGDLGRAWFWTVQYARAYAGGGTLGEGAGMLLKRLHEQWLPFGGFWLLALAGMVALLRARERRRELIFVLAFLAFAVAGTTPGLYFRGHYFVVLLPGLALVLGLGLASWQQTLRASGRAWIPAACLVLALGWSVYGQRGVFFEWPPSRIASVIYSGNPFLEALGVGEFIRTHSNPDARMAVLGSEPEMCFYARRHSATGYIYTYPLMEPQPFASSMQREMIGEIRAVKPQFMVLVAYQLSWSIKEHSDQTIFHELQDYTTQFYEPVAAIGCEPTDPRARPEQSFNSGGNLIVVYQRRPEAVNVK
jgi:4-amino-4-deoxy-L-arabinose transferase-like glycosyltransferase